MFTARCLRSIRHWPLVRFAPHSNNYCGPRFLESLPWRFAPSAHGDARGPRIFGPAIHAGLLGLALGGCSVGSGTNTDGPPTDGARTASALDAVPRAEPKSRYGNPPSYVVFGERYFVLDSADGFVERGVASWYGKKFHGRRTSSGETYDMYAMTAAHKSLPLPTYVQVTNLQNHRQLILRVNDRGPFHDNRIIDLSYTAASKLDIVRNGTGLVEVRALSPGARADLSSAQSLAQPTASTPPGAGEPRLFLQAGAFSDANNAQQLRARLMSMQTATVRVESVTVNGQPVHRVRLGPLADVASADRISNNIVEAGMELPRIVIE